MVDELKKWKKGAILSDITKRTGVVFSEALMETLKQNECLTYLEEQKRFVYKVKYHIQNEEDIMMILAEHGALKLDEHVYLSYEFVGRDVKVRHTA